MKAKKIIYASSCIALLASVMPMPMVLADNATSSSTTTAKSSTNIIYDKTVPIKVENDSNKSFPVLHQLYNNPADYLNKNLVLPDVQSLLNVWQFKDFSEVNPLFVQILPGNGYSTPELQKDNSTDGITYNSDNVVNPQSVVNLLNQEIKADGGAYNPDVLILDNVQKTNSTSNNAHLIVYNTRTSGGDIQAVVKINYNGYEYDYSLRFWMNNKHEEIISNLLKQNNMIFTITGMYPRPLAGEKGGGEIFMAHKEEQSSSITKSSSSNSSKRQHSSSSSVKAKSSSKIASSSVKSSSQEVVKSSSIKRESSSVKSSSSSKKSSESSKAISLNSSSANSAKSSEVSSSKITSSSVKSSESSQAENSVSSAVSQQVASSSIVNANVVHNSGQSQQQAAQTGTGANTLSSSTVTTTNTTNSTVPSDTYSAQKATMLAKTNATKEYAGLLTTIGLSIGTVAGWFGLKKKND